ncbi:Ig-like domain repeat protein [Nocardioides caeni]|uniref:Bacterial Ig-like domain-containing protein n=1 Tax=Nocardioides caeni TaxID=574700 RepID=A0A4S8NBJ3_9ACTN|nr:Ig-like domain repeat protein [Nocardioides caeni]THV13242.1 hypothetical protein E9934_09725 [Nocardioides caeni]
MTVRALSATLALVATSLAGVGLGAARADAAAPSNDLIANATPITGDAGSVTGTTAGATWTAVDHDTGTFDIHLSTTCAQSFYEGPPPTPTPPADRGYYIVRDEVGAVVGSRRRWNVNNPTGETPTVITDLPLVPGSHTYTVRFYYGSSYLYCAGSQTQVTVVDAQPTLTTLSAVVSRQKVTFTGSVTPAPPAGSSIQIREVHDSLLGLLLLGGAGTGSLTGVLPGKHTYIGWFESPFPAFASSTAVPVTVTVPKYVTITSLAAPTSVKVGARPTITTRVKAGGVAAKGRVVIRVNGRSVATRTLVNGTVTQRLPRLARGRATVTVVYRATTLNASSSATRVITVRR